MLGVFSPREPIAPEFSKEIRESLRRAHTGQLTERERAAHRRLKRSEQYVYGNSKVYHLVIEKCTTSQSLAKLHLIQQTSKQNP